MTTGIGRTWGHAMSPGCGTEEEREAFRGEREVRRVGRVWRVWRAGGVPQP
jgi:hypothetical protein